ncbi:Lrp/AsnC ligand binding domain-containing protein [Natronomonas sp.]|uniref:Lrp/AsnC ligand binding domain-containing protein n=1 Tax=Natronomonas sp. TaxID=2184060 RepID=UPI00261F0CCF|nr:Lrp/AsnC ligand binding domain-containing protein [Natronomonas sp.]
MTLGTMVRAFITVKTETGQAETLAGALTDIEHVTAANVVAGDFDVMVEAEAGEVYELIDAVATRVRGTEAVEETKTYVCLE